MNRLEDRVAELERKLKRLLRVQTARKAAGELYAAAGNQILANSITLVAGTNTSGTVADVQTVNQTYYTVQETAKFDIQFSFTGMPSVPRIVNVVGYYEGNPAHNVWIYAYNFTTTTWDRLTTAAQDFPDTTEDEAYAFEFPTDSSDYLSGAETRIRIYHDSAAVSSHYMYVDYIQIQAESINMTTPGTFYSATNLSEGVEYETTLNGTNGTITINRLGIYDIAAQVSFTGMSGATIDCHIFVDGVKVDKLGFTRTISSGSAYGSASICGKYEFSGTEVVTIRAESDMPSTWISIDQLNLSVGIVN